MPSTCSPTSTIQFNEQVVVTEYSQGGTPLLPRLGIWEGQIIIVLHHHYLEVMLFVNMPMLAAIPIQVVLPVVPPMVVPTPVIRTEVTAMATKGARAVVTILKIRVQMRMI